MILPNPFKPLKGRINNSSDFFERKQEIAKIFSHLKAGSAVYVFGSRKIGKSSLLREVQAQADIQGYDAIYVSLNWIGSEDEFYKYVFEEAHIWPKHDIWPKHTECPKGYFFFRCLKERAMIRKRQILLIVDGVARREGFTRQVRSHLKGLSEGRDAPIRLVLSGFQTLSILFPEDETAERSTSPLVDLCINLELKEWDTETCQAFIRDRLLNSEVQFSLADIEEAIAVSKGHPQKLMEFCFRLYQERIDPD